MQAYMQGLDADSRNEDLLEKRSEAETELSSEEIEAVMVSLYGPDRSALANGGRITPDSAAQPSFFVNVSLTFSKVIHLNLCLRSLCR